MILRKSVVFQLAAAITQYETEVLKVDKLRKFEHNFVELIPLEKATQIYLFLLCYKKQSVCEEWVQAESGKYESEEAEGPETKNTHANQILSKFRQVVCSPDDMSNVLI